MSLREWAVAMKDQCAILALALKDPRTPWYAKACGVFTLLYALSPIDLIPDFIPIIGYLDDLVIVPLGLWLARRLIPPIVWEECKAEVQRRALGRPKKDWRGAIIIVAIYAVLLCVVGIYVYRYIRR